MEHVIRQTIIALRLADLLALEEQERVVVYYSGLLAWVGCHTDAYEQAKWFGDDIAMKRESMFAGDNVGDLARLLVRRLGSGGSVADRIRTSVSFPVSGLRWFSSILESHWKATDLLAEQLGLGEDVRRSLMESYERWDGRGIAGGKVRTFGSPPGWSISPTWSPRSKGWRARTPHYGWHANARRRAVRPRSRRPTVRQRR